MPKKTTITGKAVIPILLMAALIVGVRAIAILRGEVDPGLRKALEDQITVDVPTAQLKQVQQLARQGGAAKKMSSMMTVPAPKAEKPVIKSVRTTKSIFEFSTEKRDVIAEVHYTIGGVERVEYYRLEHAPGWKAWRGRGKSSKTSFYLHLF